MPVYISKSVEENCSMCLMMFNKFVLAGDIFASLANLVSKKNRMREELRSFTDREENTDSRRDDYTSWQERPKNKY